MSRYVLNNQGGNQIINRATALTATTKCLWGSMTVDEMLFHCNLTNQEILKAQPYEKLPKFKQRFFKYLVMRILKKLPKNVKINPKFLKQAQQELDFEIEKNKFIETINQFIKREGAIYGKHPFFGKLNTDEWRHFVWMHMDHHLRQFGV